jgi:hypothetical protein
MKQRSVHRLAGIALISMAAPAAPQAGESIVGDALVALVSGRSWALSTYGNTSNPATAMVWDFRKDGSVCARFAGAEWATSARMRDCGELTVTSSAGI